MNIPTPKDMPQHKPVVSAEELEQSPIQDKPKPAFVRKPHLTDRPLKNDPHLQLLKTRLVMSDTNKAFKGLARDATKASKSNRQFPNNKK